jgi:hypothetical protein
MVRCPDCGHRLDRHGEHGEAVSCRNCGFEGILVKKPSDCKEEYQYGASDPADSEEEAFANWCKDNLEVKR